MAASKTLTKAIEKISVPGKRMIEIEGLPAKIEINEDVDLRLLDKVIDTIVEQVVAQGFKYSLIDIMEAYYIIALFTNIPVPTIDDKTKDGEDGDIIPDYQKCYVIEKRLDLSNELMEASPVICDMIIMLERNVWRQLEYKKALLSLTPYDSMLDVMSQMYELLDDLNKYIEQYADIDVDNIADRISDISKQLSVVKDLKEDKKANKTS